MTKRVLLALYCPLLLMWATWMLLATSVHAQESIGQQRAYTVADPVRPDAIGLATAWGRFMVSKADACSTMDIHAAMNVELWLVEGFSGIGTISPLDADGNWDPNRWCGVRFEQLADPTPCLASAEGACDVALEQREDT